MKNRKLQIWLPLILSIMVVIGIVIGFSIRGNMPGKGIFYMEKPKTVQEVLDLINNKYVDNINSDTLTTLAVSGMLAKLDPHSVFLPAEDLQQVNEEISGHFYGIGIEYNIYDDTLNILNVLPGGPSARAGLLIGDKLIKVSDSLVAGVKANSAEIRKLLRGNEGTTVSVSILRNNQIKNVIIKREGIPIYSLDASYMITSSTGYIRLNKFSENTYKEFMQAAEKLKREGMKNMILDLRDNGGGILTEATDIADEFLPGDKLITYTEGLHSARKEYRCKRDGIFENGKIAVLTNEGTASASEVLIGALQDWDRAIIIGRRTFGKGLVQEQYELSDGSGLRLTVARYYTPLGRSIQKSYSSGNIAYKEELHHRYMHGELLSADSNKNDTGKVFITPSGKKVYGGGGITPDIFVAIDTSSFTKNIGALYTRGTLNNFAYRDYMKNKSIFSTYKSAIQFENKYDLPRTDLDDLLQFAIKDSIKIEKFNEQEKIELNKQLKLLLAQQIWHTEGLYEASNSDDPVIKKALEIINK